MKNIRCYYSADIAEFLFETPKSILGTITANDPAAETLYQQKATWIEEIALLRSALAGFTEGRILFEYTIPRMGRRVDVTLLYRNIVYLMEFKCGDDTYRAATYDQVYDYALDLRNFQKESHDKLIVPVMVSTKAQTELNVLREHERIIEPLRCNDRNLRSVILEVAEAYPNEPPFDYAGWEASEYLPTPTIVEAAQALYRGHDVHEITRSDAGAENLTVTTGCLNDIINKSRAEGRKSICFVTGVPGAGKTLVGLNLAIEMANANEGEHAVFLSGNFPLVQVLQEALARDHVAREAARGVRITKKDALRKTSAFIQIIHKYRDSFVGNSNVPPERIAIFDEAQRAWTVEQISKFMSTKKGVPDFDMSEPEFLISTMDRHTGWAVIVCLVGGGQEINTGEAGLPEWFDSLRKSFPGWDVYVTPQLDDTEYRRERSWQEMTAGLRLFEAPGLHLATSVRSFRTPDLAAFVKSLLDVDIPEAKRLLAAIGDKYPVRLTRDLKLAKDWVREQCRGTTRYGLLASSGALRLKPEGIFVKNETDIANWFLNGKDDVRASYALEDAVTEFDIQGLELDYTVVAWDADFRFDGSGWTYNNFSGNTWQLVRAAERRLYLKNTYRVLLTRARQGMVIFVPEGSDTDESRKRAYYDKTYRYLRSLGIEELALK